MRGLSRLLALSPLPRLAEPCLGAMPAKAKTTTAT